MENNQIDQLKYCYEGTNVLKNKKDIKNLDKLHEIENGLTTFKLTNLYLNDAPFKKTFDINHYLGIHKYLFEELYEFAGTFRETNISKSREPYAVGITPFCQVQFIKNQLEYTLQDMKNNVRNINCEEELIEFISKYYLELNIIHPFREGNGRTLREFLREYVLVLNKIIKFGEFELDYTLIDENIKDSLVKASILDELEEAKKVFSKIIVKKDEIIKEKLI